ncbi:CK1 family protein kinase [Tritrichomonas foetus]|uniref:non-specific serine/threonine protein kinase n=1 Tax=Tritrichomonas foetus TaxID=1144522 RepID=A0A1J4K3J8_9EUKA|nr:CK1 family protein kinase [Tritrichomonas foetus]|eukprot:OHT06017.1 CK1 family protein kinase [Tritrichomonas foetus]
MEKYNKKLSRRYCEDQKSEKVPFRMTSSGKKERKQLKTGDRIADFTVVKALGRGGYGDIYYVSSKLQPDKNYAMKVENITGKKSHLLIEKRVLSKLQDSQYFPRYIAFGQTTLFKYLVMECLGPSLSTVRRVLPKAKFSLSSSLRIGIETLRTIEAFHQHGYVHRDIKPSNFLIRPSLSTPILLIDFGLAKKYIKKKTGDVIPPRERSGFAGTTKYASLNAHENKELGRRDDLFSWLFSLFEIMTGKLPWVSSRDKQETYDSKLLADVEGFCKPLPKQIFSIYKLIKMYNYEDEPDYNLIISFLVEAMRENDCSWDDKYEWQLLSHEDLLNFSVMTMSPPTGDQPLIPSNLPQPIIPQGGNYQSSSTFTESYESETSEGFIPSKPRPTPGSCPAQEPKIDRMPTGSGRRNSTNKNCLIQ